MREILKGPGIVYFLVKSLKEKYPDKQIGRTVIQKLLYLLETESELDLGYTLYHYGPYSSTVGEFINMAEALNLIEVNWDFERGYFIKPIGGDDKIMSIINEEVGDLVRRIEEIVNKFGSFTANELSIIATAIYVKNNFGISRSDEIIRTVLSLKPQNKRDWIENLLRKANVIG